MTSGASCGGSERTRRDNPSVPLSRRSPHAAWLAALAVCARGVSAASCVRLCSIPLRRGTPAPRAPRRRAGRRATAAPRRASQPTTRATARAPRRRPPRALCQPRRSPAMSQTSPHLRNRPYAPQEPPRGARYVSPPVPPRLRALLGLGLSGHHDPATRVRERASRGRDGANPA